MVRIISLGRCIYLLLIERAEYSQEGSSRSLYEKLCLFCRVDKLWVVQWFLKTACKAAAGNAEVNVDWFVEGCWPPGCSQWLEMCSLELFPVAHLICCSRGKLFSTGFWFLLIQISSQSIFLKCRFTDPARIYWIKPLEGGIWALLLNKSIRLFPPSYF